MPRHVAYWQGGNLHYRRSANGGATWSDAVTLTSGGTAQYPCSLERTGSTLHLIWPDRRHAGKWEVYYKRSTDGGATWGKDIRLSPSSGHARHPQILAVGDGQVCLIWEDGQVWEGGQKWSGDGAMYAAVSQDNGQTWAEPQRLTFVNSPNGRATHAKSFAADRRIHLTWTDALPGSNTDPIRAQVPYYTTSLDGGLTWQPARTPTAVAARRCSRTRRCSRPSARRTSCRPCSPRSLLG